MDVGGVSNGDVIRDTGVDSTWRSAGACATSKPLFAQRHVIRRREYEAWELESAEVWHMCASDGTATADDAGEDASVVRGDSGAGAFSGV